MAAASGAAEDAATEDAAAGIVGWAEAVRAASRSIDEEAQTEGRLLHLSHEAVLRLAKLTALFPREWGGAPLARAVGYFYPSKLMGLSPQEGNTNCPLEACTASHRTNWLACRSVCALARCTLNACNSAPVPLDLSGKCSDTQLPVRPHYPLTAEKSHMRSLRRKCLLLPPRMSMPGSRMQGALAGKALGVVMIPWV